MNKVQSSERNLTMVMDFYEMTMSNGYFKSTDRNKRVAFAIISILFYDIDDDKEKLGKVINGVKVKITLVTQHAENVMTVPIDAVYHESEKSYVYTYVGGKANKVYRANP